MPKWHHDKVLLLACVGYLLLSMTDQLHCLFCRYILDPTPQV